MTKNQKRFADYIQAAFSDKEVIVMIGVKRLAIVDSLEIGIQPKGKRIKQFDMIVPKSEGDYPEAVKGLVDRINKVYKENVV